MSMVAVPEPGAAIEGGLNVTVTPVGAPDAESAMALLNPPLTDVVIVKLPELPCTTLKDVGEALTVKLGGITYGIVNVDVAVAAVPTLGVPVVVAVLLIEPLVTSAAVVV